MLDPDTDFNDRNLEENEEVIAKTIKYLEYHNPENANRDYAVGLLKFAKRIGQAMADKSIDFEEFVERYNKSLEK